MRKIIAALATSALLLGATPALAGGYGQHHGHYRHGHHGGHGAAVFGALLGGLLIGNLIAQASSPPPRYRPAPQPALGNCRYTTGRAYLNGRLARFGGTMCYDGYGNAYIVTGSEHFIGYLR
jgi:hypothetical protein